MTILTAGGGTCSRCLTWISTATAARENDSSDESFRIKLLPRTQESTVDELVLMYSIETFRLKGKIVGSKLCKTMDFIHKTNFQLGLQVVFRGPEVYCLDWYPIFPKRLFLEHILAVAPLQ